MKILSALILGLSLQSFAQDKARYVLPWQIIPFNAELQVFHKKDFEFSQGELAKYWLENPKPVNANKSTNNLKLAVAKFLESENKDSQIAIEPILCSVADQYIFFLQKIDVNTDHLLKTVHRAYPRRPFTDLKNFRSEIGRVANALSDELAQKSAAQNSSALKVNLATSKEPGRLDEGSSLCLNLLLAERLHDQFQILRTIGRERFENLRRVYSIKRPPSRSTRTALIEWRIGGMQKFPFKAEADYRLSESVIASHIENHRFTYDFKVENNQIQFAADQKLKTILTNYQLSLMLDESPQIAKVHGAWVYLDKGRAYGLKIADRMVVKTQEQEIKGHIVGYFGPGLKLKSPRGFDIHEGAIMFIRKGQRKTKVGQELDFDQTKYPTPWPPQ